MKKHNFNPGPAVLPQSAIDATIEAMKNYAGTGMSIMEVSHRGKEFDATMKETRNLLKEVLSIPEGYQVLFLGGGARLQFSMIPYNFMEKKAVYYNTGAWAKYAIKEAKCFGEVKDIVNPEATEAERYSYLPSREFLKDIADYDYLHITSNNTIFGTELFEDLNSPIPLIADMSSDICSRPIDVSKYAMIYGGAQKNMGPAGVTFIIVKEELLGKVTRKMPEFMDYRSHIKNDSMYNTPPVVNIYTLLHTLKWVQAQGGVAKLYEINKAKAQLLYNEIDSNPLFKGTVAKEVRSIMNVCFIMEDKYKDLEEEFAKLAAANGMVGVKGHRSVGGFRASIYNACPTESVQALVDLMKEFAAKKA